MTNLFNKRVIVVFDPTKSDTKKITGVVTCVILGGLLTEPLITFITINTSQLGECPNGRLIVRQIGNKFFCQGPVIIIPDQTPSPQPMIGQRNVFDLWKKRVSFNRKSATSVKEIEGIVGYINCYTDSYKTPVSYIGIKSGNEEFFLKQNGTTLIGIKSGDKEFLLKQNEITSLIFPDERNLQLLNKRFKRIMSLDALSVVAKYLINVPSQ